MLEQQQIQDSVNGFYLYADDAASPGTGKTGLTITATLSKNGAAAASVSPTITEIAGGVYWVVPDAGNRDTLGTIAWQFAGTGAVIAPHVETIVAATSEATIATAVIAGILPSATTFQTQTGQAVSDEIRIKQRDDYSAVDGRAYEWTITNPSIDFTDPDVTMGPAVGTNGTDTLTATASLLNKADGSCTLRLEFTSAQTDVEPGRYEFDAHFLVDTRRLTGVDLSVTVEEKYAD